MRLVGNHIPRERSVDPQYAAKCANCRLEFDERELTINDLCLECESRDQQLDEVEEEMEIAA